MVYKKNPWVEEEELVPEASINQRYFGESYQAWNMASPELEFCLWVAAEAHRKSLEKDHINILETGMGGGYITRRILSILNISSFKYTAFEDMLELIQYVPEDVRICVKPGTPHGFEFERADLVVLDSAPKYRDEEIKNSAAYCTPGTSIFIHDAEMALTPLMNGWAKTAEKFIVPIAKDFQWLENPRGGFMAEL